MLSQRRQTICYAATRHLLAVLVILLSSSMASAQVAEPRQIAARGNTDPTDLRAPNESVIAVGPDRVITIFNAGYPEFGPDIGYAVGYPTPEPSDPDKWTWMEEGFIDNPVSQYSVDPSMVHVPDLNNPAATGSFFGVAFGQGLVGKYVMWTRYSDGTGFDEWDIIEEYDPYHSIR
jgi:hypothetical protein